MLEFLRRLFLPIKIILDTINNYFKTFVFITIVVLLISLSNDNLSQVNNLAKIELSGEITDDSAKSTLRFLQDAYEDDGIKGILLIVSSPGGAVSPSVEISQYVKKIRENKPVVVYAKGTIASGSYYSSIYANKIIANSGSMVGSIGVVFQGYNLKELFDKIGLKEQSIQVGKYKMVGTINREWMPHEKDELNKVMSDIYDTFVSEVANARGLNVNDKEIFADARIFTAKQAKEIGLVDSVGIEYEAVNDLKRLSNVEKANFLIYKETDISKVLEDMVSNILVKTVQSLNTTYFGM